MTDEWGPWIEHDWSGFPPSLLGIELWLMAEDANGDAQEQIGRVMSLDADFLKAWDWSFYRLRNPANTWNYSRVIRYKIRRPKALIALIEMAANLPERVEA